MCISFSGAEKRVATAVADNASGYFRRDAVTGINVKEEIEKTAKVTAEELNKAVKAKYLPYTIDNNSSKDAEELGKAYARAHGIV